MIKWLLIAVLCSIIGATGGYILCGLLVANRRDRDIVYCKECKYADNQFMSGIWCNHPDNRNPLGCRPNDFCNDGRRF